MATTFHKQEEVKFIDEGDFKMPKKKTENVPAKREEAGLPSTMLQNDAGMGFENVDAASQTVPFLIVLQSQSPQIDSIVGAKAGMFFNTATKELFTECIVIPCGFKRSFIRWAPRDEGGGFKGEYSAIDVDQGNVEGLGKDSNGWPCIGNDKMSDTRAHFLLVKTEAGHWEPAVLSLSSTQVKKSKLWITQMMNLRVEDVDGLLPSFSHSYKLTTVPESNVSGSWYGVNFEMNERNNAVDLYAMAKAFNLEVSSGAVKTDEPTGEKEADPNAI